MSDLPWTLRAEGAPSETTLDAYVTGELDGEAAAAVEAWAQADPAHKAALDARRAGFDGLPGANAQAMWARIQQAVDAPAPAPARPPARRLRWPVWLGLAAAAAAAAAVLLARRPAPPPTGGGDTVTVKGSLGLRVFRKRGEASAELVSGDAAQAGDRLRFVATGGPADGHLLVLGVEADGDRFPYVPGDGQALPAARLGADGALPGAAALDGSKGRERAVLVWCPQPFALSDISGSGAALAVPTGCQQTAFEISKP